VEICAESEIFPALSLLEGTTEKKGGGVMRLFRNELILLAILLLGLCLRIYHLSYESIWLDEATSIKLATSSFFQLGLASNSRLYHILVHHWIQLFGNSEFFTQFIARMFGLRVLFYSDTNPPLYHILLHYWINLFGNSEFSTRFLSVIFGFFAIFMLYKVGSLIFYKEVGIISSLILGLNTFHIYYSQEARMYILNSLLTLLSMYFFIRLLKERGLMIVIGYILSSILLMYTHIFGLFILLAQNIYIMTLFLFTKENYKLKIKAWILLQALLIILFTPWISALTKRIINLETNGFWIPVPTVHTIIDTFYRYSNNSRLFYLFTLLSFFSIVTYEKIKGSIYWRNLFKSIEDYQLHIRFSNVDKIYLLFLWLLTPIILPFIISRFSTPIYWYRYTIGASLAFYLLVAVGIRNIGHKYVRLAVISVIIVVSLTQIWRYYTTIHKEQWRDIASYIDINANQRDLIIFSASDIQMPFDYYSKRTDLIKKPFPENTGILNEESITGLRATVEGKKRIWLILLFSGYGGLIKKTISESYGLSYHKDYSTMNYIGSTSEHVIEVYLFEKKVK
jgi:mannosyltransferase